jgi:glycosyltransferase involved in cell wall biosynthesis
MPEASVALDIFGIVQGQADLDRLSELRTLAGGDGRIRFLPAIPNAAIVDALADYDLVAVPSQWLETGPLVVLEAQAAGVPVLGSALGGIADRIRDEWNGLLVRPFNSVAAWRAALARCDADRPWLSRLRSRVRPPRQMREVAREMAVIYAQVAGRRASTGARHAG